MPSAFEEVFGDTAADWASVNPVMGPNVLCVETDTGKMKVSNGVLAYNSLGYAVSSPTFARSVNAPSNVVTPSTPARTNTDVPFFGALTDQTAALISGEATLVPVAVNVGDTISNVIVLAGATPESGGSHAWAAIYSGVATTAVLQGAQSVDATGAAVITASHAYTFALGTAVPITAAIAPYGYIYVAISVTGTVPSLLSGTAASGAEYAWFTGTPLFAATSGSALAGVAPASFTLASGVASTKVPAVFLT